MKIIVLQVQIKRTLTPTASRIPEDLGIPKAFLLISGSFHSTSCHQVSNQNYESFNVLRFDVTERVTSLSVLHFNDPTLR